MSSFPVPLVNIIRMKLNEAPPQTVVRMKAVWIWERDREREGELLLSEHDLPVGLQGHLLAESDCGRLQLSSSRRGSEGKRVVWIDSLYSPACLWPTARGLTAARPQLYTECGFLNLLTLGVFSLCNQYSLPLLQRAAGTEFTATIQTVSTNTGAAETTVITAACETAGIITSFAFQDRGLPRSPSAQSLSSLSSVRFISCFL